MDRSLGRAVSDIGAKPLHEVSPQVEAYVTDVVRVCTAPTGSLGSLILFGSAATGGYAAAISDVDLLIVLADEADVIRPGNVQHARAGAGGVCRPANTDLKA